MQDALTMTELTDSQKATLSARFITLLNEYKVRSKRYSHSFNFLRSTITVGSLIVPALLSVQYATGNVNSSTANIGAEVYWVVWNLSLLVTISNGIMSMLKVDKKYFILNTTYQHLISEGWQYIHLSGKYSGFYTPNTTATHKNQFVYFCNSIEKIRMKQVEDEYYKVDTSHSNTQPGQHEQLVPPTPLNPTSLSDQKSLTILNEDAPTPKEIPTSLYGEQQQRPPQAATVRKKNTGPQSSTQSSTQSSGRPQVPDLFTIAEGNGDEYP